VNQGFEKIAAYQDIRAMAMRARDFNVAFVGSAVGFLLPFFYALLGANAAVLRQLHVETRNSTFHPEHSKIEKREASSLDDGCDRRHYDRIVQ
jgi:hypothetical protein